MGRGHGGKGGPVRPSGLLMVIVAVNVAVLVLYAVAPRWRAPLLREDRGVETATALLFLASFLVAAVGLVRRSPDRYRALLFVGGGLGLIAFLDEVSFGARLFGWSMPEMSGGGEFDGAHDLVVLAYRLGSEAGPVVLGALLVLVFATAVICALRWRAPLTARWGRIVTEPVLRWFALCVGGLGLASIVDLRDGTFPHLGLAEEMLELNAGWALLLSMLLAVRTFRRQA